MCSFFGRPGIRNFIVYYTGHGKGTGDWWLPDKSWFKLKHILTIWSEHQHRSSSQELLLIMDSCYSGANVKRLNRYHQQKKFMNVEVIAARGVAIFTDFGSALTTAIYHDMCCPVRTVCTRSLIKSNTSKPVRVTRKHSCKCYPRLKFDWKLINPLI